MTTKVLVMENTEGVSDMLSFSRTADYDVTTAENAAEAIKLLSETRYQLIVSDVNVPDMDGIEFLCHIKKHHPGTEVIITSDVENRDIGLKSLKYEASDFIVRPFTGEALDIVLERARRKIAIRRKLSPARQEAHHQEDHHTERITMAAQLIGLMGNARQGEALQISSMIAVHSPDGGLIHASHDYINSFGDIKGKKSWDIYSEKTESDCPVIIAFKSMEMIHQTAVVKNRKGETLNASIFAAPLASEDGKIDLVLEVISF